MDAADELLIVAAPPCHHIAEVAVMTQLWNSRNIQCRAQGHCMAVLGLNIASRRAMKLPS